MQSEFLGLNDEAIATRRACVRARGVLALLVGCVLVISGICGLANGARLMADMIANPESSRDCPANESEEEDSSESEAIVGLKSSARRYCRTEVSSPVFCQRSNGLCLSARASRCPATTPTRELDNRNGVVAPLRC